MALSSHVIDQIAQNTFRNSVPPAWLKRDQHPDFYLDYFVEVFEKNEPTGSVFAVQLKGKEKPSISNNYVKYPMKKKHLNYYQDKAKFPVFLFVVDVINRKCWYVFVQEYLQKAICSKKWNGSKGLTIKIPISNDTSNHAQLLNDVMAAELFMNNLRPGSIESAVETAKLRYTKIDERFNVGMEIKDKSTKYIISPKPDANVDVRVAFNTTNDKLEDLLGRGKQVELKLCELKFTGSDLFDVISEDVDPNSKVLVRAGHELDGELSITCRNKRHDIFTMHGIKGKIRGGYREINFEGELPNSPLTLSLAFPFPAEKGFDNKGTFNLSFDADNWEGQPISLLAYFNQIYKLVEGLRSAQNVMFECETNGNLMVGANVDSEGFSELESSLREPLDIIKKVREISSTLGYVTAMPKYSLLQRKDVEDIYILYDLVVNREISRGFSTGNVVVNLSSLKVTTDELNAMAERKESFFLDFTGPNIYFLGKLVPGWVIKYELTEPSVKRIRLDFPKVGETEIELNGSRNSKLFYRLHQLPITREQDLAGSRLEK